MGLAAVALGGGMHSQESMAQLVAEQQQIEERIQLRKQQLKRDESLSEELQHGFDRAELAPRQQQRRKALQENQQQHMGADGGRSQQQNLSTMDQPPR